MNKNKNKGGRPTLPPEQKKKHRIAFYLSDDEMKKLDRLKIGIVRHSPALSLNDFFRLLLDNFDETLIPYMLEKPNSEVKRFMSSNLAYSKIFDE